MPNTELVHQLACPLMQQDNLLLVDCFPVQGRGRPIQRCMRTTELLRELVDILLQQMCNTELLHQLVCLLMQHDNLLLVCFPVQR